MRAFLHIMETYGIMSSRNPLGFLALLSVNEFIPRIVEKG